jgi:hypothetical protein
VKFDGSAEDVADLMDRHVDQSGQKHPKPSVAEAHNIRMHALRLYRKILRYSLLFNWPDEHGELWRDKLRRNARQEFEASRLLHDAETIVRLLVTGQQAVDEVLERFLSKRSALEKEGQGGNRASYPPSHKR